MLIASLIATVLIAVAAWFGLRGRLAAAGLMLLAALAPLLANTTIVKAVFIWLGLVGPIAILVVMLNGLIGARD